MDFHDHQPWKNFALIGGLEPGDWWCSGAVPLYKKGFKCLVKDKSQTRTLANGTKD